MQMSAIGSNAASVVLAEGEDTPALEQIFRGSTKDRLPRLVTLDGEMGAAIERRFCEIELARKRFVEARRSVEMLDYGAGFPGLKRSVEDAQAGRRVSRRVGELALAGKSAVHCELLFSLVRQFRPLQCLELGTCLGFSCAYQAVALACNGSGSITTVEGCPTLAGIAERLLRSLSLDTAHVVCGKFADCLPKILRDLGKVDYVFLDGDHSGEHVIGYFTQIRPYLRGQSSVFILDDIGWDESMRAAWGSIKEDPIFVRTGVCEGMGIAVAVTKERRMPGSHLHLLEAISGHDLRGSCGDSNKVALGNRRSREGAVGLKRRTRQRP